ncbi:MAG: osmoprotectant NAGGN system M42 family peptidase [Deltaproteobacteria bacterium CG11_big_fil_rev_8_21_14_0_20_45_16]|nr:MAG: osmoprotectant NAGGN system M42 family peptidase [Deltaproteobacteria bacterium CG11_big_fil_rev_8_21_14_0_20_45_16]
MNKLKIDRTYLKNTLKKLLEIPSPSGYTDSIVHFVGSELESLGVPFELTRRGAIRANLKGKNHSPDRAIVAHVDTLGAMVRGLKQNGRLDVAPIGTWSARFAEGARVTIFSDNETWHRGTILPLKASGHVYNEAIDTQPVSWDNLEIRVDVASESKSDIQKVGIAIGDFVAIDPNSEFLENGFIASRHLDNKAGVALLLAAARAVLSSKAVLPVDCHLLFTISEEVGSGASHILHQDVAEILSIDNATSAPGQNSLEAGVTIAMMDSTGPFDFHLTHKLIKLCKDNEIPFARDVFRYYRCDAASAVEAGNDLRAALVCFGCDASHGYERTHMNSLVGLAELLALYMQSDPTFKRDEKPLGPLRGFSEQPIEKFSL